MLTSAIVMALLAVDCAAIGGTIGYQFGTAGGWRAWRRGRLRRYRCL